MESNQHIKTLLPLLFRIKPCLLHLLLPSPETLGFLHLLIISNVIIIQRSRSINRSMKRPFFLRLPFRLLPIIAVLTLLTFRSAVRRNSISDQLLLSNTTLLRLSSTDLADSVVKRDVDDLIEGKFPTYSRDSSIPRRHRIDGIRSMNRRLGLGIQIRFPSFHNNKLFPELRKSLHQWWKNRRFQPEIMSELVDLVKLPLDRHRGKENSVGRFGSCAVVGNSGILLKNDYGDLIDSHELVIRLNNARIHGFQRNVGAKTDLSFVNSNILHLCGRRPSCFCHPYGDTVPMIMYICQAAHFLDYTICNSSYKAPLLITDIRFDMLCSRIAKYYSMRRFAEVEGKRLEDWGKFHDEKLFHYSSGMQAVLLAVGICDRVGVFGFGKSADAKHHYHTNQKVELDLHDYAAEYDFYRDLIDRPEVIPFLKDSGIRVPPLVLYH